MKRKSLLVAMASVSLAAIGAGTVSTLAWFSAQAAAESAGTQAAKGITVTNTAASAGGLVFTVKFGEVTYSDSKIYPTEASTGDVYYMVGESIVKDTTASTSASRWATVTVDVEITKSAAATDATLEELFTAIPTTANRYTVTLAKDSANLRVHLTGDNKFVANTENDADMKFALATSDFAHVAAVADNPATTEVNEAYPEHYHLSAVKTVYLTVNGGTASANSGIKNSDLTNGSVSLGLTGQISGGSIGA